MFGVVTIEIANFIGFFPIHGPAEILLDGCVGRSVGFLVHDGFRGNQGIGCGCGCLSLFLRSVVSGFRFRCGRLFVLLKDGKDGHGRTGCYGD